MVLDDVPASRELPTELQLAWVTSKVVHDDVQSQGLSGLFTVARNRVMRCRHHDPLVAAGGSGGVDVDIEPVLWLGQIAATTHVPVPLNR